MGRLRAALFFLGVQRVTQFARVTEGKKPLKISYSRYTTFVNNPEHYRLSYELGLTPEGDDTPSLFNYGRRRGSCFHALMEGVPRADVVKSYGGELVKRCEEMQAVVPPLDLDWVERSFEIPIMDGKHSIIGRIDHRYLNRDGIRQPGDFKTTKGTRTKAQLQDYYRGLEDSTQHHFYLRAEREWTDTPTGLFTYHIVFDRKDKDHKPTYVPLEIPYIGPEEVNRTMAAVYAACETILFLREYGIEKPWPDSRKWCVFNEAYRALAGRTIPKGCDPQGFTSRYKDQIQAEA